MVVAAMDALSDPCRNILTRRANQWHNCIVPQLQNAHGPAQQWALRRDCRQKILTHNYKLHRLAEVASVRHGEGSPLALPSRARFPMREPEEIST